MRLGEFLPGLDLHPRSAASDAAKPLLPHRVVLSLAPFHRPQVVLVGVPATNFAAGTPTESETLRAFVACHLEVL